MNLSPSLAEFFLTEPGFASPYMSFAVPVRTDKRELIPAIVHHDGTARLQTIHPNLSPNTYGLLKSWQRISGIPVLLNTSFNDREPIVQQPSEALATFLRLPLDGIYFADFEILVTRSERTDQGTAILSENDDPRSSKSPGAIKHWFKQFRT